MNQSMKLATLLFSGWLAACSTDGGPSGEASTTPEPTAPGAAPMADGTGRLELRLVDAPADDVKEIIVTITRVEAHVTGGGGWLTLGKQTATIDLLKLQNGTFAQLGVTKMPTGKVTQLRLYVKEDGPNYVTTPDGVQHPLKVPSGPQSGIKIKGGFHWNKCAMGNVTIDFDGKKSIHVHPTGGKDLWILRPVVRLKSVSVTGDACMPDAGTQPPQPEADAGVPPMMDAGMPLPPIDSPPPGNTPPIGTVPPGDPCANVECTDGLFCMNGMCMQSVD